MVSIRFDILFLAIALLLVMPARAATITVTEAADDDPTVNNGLCSLREAVITANTDTQVDACLRDGISVVDLIVFDPATDKDLTQNSLPAEFSAELTLGGANEDAAMTGDLDITENLRIVGNYNLQETVTQEKATFVLGAEPAFNDRIFHVHANVTLLLEDLIFAGGNSVPTGAGILGVAGSDLGLDNVVVFANRAEGNSFPGIGGGILTVGSLSLTDSIVAGNIVSTTGNEVASGAGIASGGALTLERVLVTQNRLNNENGDARGAGIYYSDQTAGGLTIVDSHITENTGATSGTGDLLGLGLYHAQGQTTIAGSTFSLQNVAGMSDPANAFGGGIYSLDPMALTNTTISNNNLDATGIVDGAGVFVGEADATLNLNNVTVFENSAVNFMATGLGGGVSNSFGASVNLSNSIIAGNSANTASPDCRGTITSAGYNLLSDDSDCTFMAATGDQVGTAAAPIDPVLDQLTFDPATSFVYPVSDMNVGLIAYHPLLDGSTAIDTADPMDPAMGGSCEIVDVRGETRPQDGDGDAVAICDMGAYEVSPASSAGGGGSGSSSGGCSLGEGKARLDPVLSLLVLLAVGWLVVGWFASRRTRRPRSWK